MGREEGGDMDMGAKVNFPIRASGKWSLFAFVSPFEVFNDLVCADGLLNV